MLTFAASADVQSSYDAAVAAFGAKQYDVAAKSFEAVLDDGMDDDSVAGLVANAKANLPVCYFQIGLAAAKTGEFDKAITNLSTSAEIAELYGDMQNAAKAGKLLGMVYQKQGGQAFNSKDYTTAAQVFEKGYASDPRNTQMANWLGISLCETGKFQEGFEVFEQVVALGASNSKYAEGAAEANKNIQLYTNNQVAALQAKKDYNGVISLADALLAKNPMSAIAAKIRLQAYSDKKDYAKVFSLAKEAADLQTSAAEKSNIYFILGAAYNAKEMRPEAITAFKKVATGPNAATAKATITELEK